LTPFYEEQIKGRNEAGAPLWSQWGYDNRECLSRGDNWATSGSNRDFNVLFDNVLFNAANWWNNGDDAGYLRHYVPEWPSGDNTYAAQNYLSFDLGREAKYTRFKTYIRNRNNGEFAPPFFTVFELWGASNPKPLLPEATNDDRLENLRYWTSWSQIDGTDEWKNDWVQLGDYSLVLPSGATMSGDVLTDEDKEFIRNGFEFEIDPDKINIPCRYIRLVIKKSNIVGSRPGGQMGEMQFFGAYPK
jgi:hypothetical protein